MIRKAQCAGTWYPRREKEIKEFIDDKKEKTKAFGAMCPHAGWIYSGKTAGKVFGSLLPADVYIILGPNHSAAGTSATSLYPNGSWEFPFGSLSVDEGMCKKIMKKSEFIKEDPDAFQREHSIEVQCPFIAMANPSATIIPILMRDYDPDICFDLGRSIADVIFAYPHKKTLIIASSDMSHYEPANLARTLDESAIDEIVKLEPLRLQVVERKGITMCGSGPVAVLLFAAKQLGAKQGILIDYSNSGDVTGDYSSVVGYAGMIVI